MLDKKTVTMIKGMLRQIAAEYDNEYHFWMSLVLEDAIKILEEKIKELKKDA